MTYLKSKQGMISSLMLLMAGASNASANSYCGTGVVTQGEWEKDGVTKRISIQLDTARCGLQAGMAVIIRHGLLSTHLYAAPSKVSKNEIEVTLTKPRFEELSWLQKIRHNSDLDLGYFLQSAEKGTQVSVQAISTDKDNSYTLDSVRERSIMFISGGIGVTPNIALLKALDEQNPIRSVSFLYSFHTNEDYLFQKDLEAISTRNSKGLFLKTFATRSTRRLGITDIKEALEHFDPSPFHINTDVFICGSSRFNADMQDYAQRLGVPYWLIHVCSN